MTLGVGLELGGDAVTVAAVRRRRDGLRLEALARLPLAALAETGADVTSPASLARAAAAELARRGLPRRGLVLGVSGRDANIRYSHLPPMPAWRMALLTRLEVADVAERTGEALSADSRVLPGGADGTLVLVALAKDARVLEVVAAWQAAGAEVGQATPLAVAVGDGYRLLDDAAARRTTLVVHLGHGSSEVALVELGELAFARSVALGVEVAVERVARVLGVDEAAAAEAVRTGQGPDGAPLDEDLLRGPRQQLATMVTASVDFARQQLKRKKLTVEHVAVSGPGARVPGVVAAIGAAVEAPASVFDPLEHLDAGAADRASRDDAAAYGVEAAAAVGLALAAALPGARPLDLLPNQLKDARTFRHRTVWLRAAGGVLAASLLVGLGLGVRDRAGQRDRQAALGQAKAAVGRRLAAHQDRERENAARDQSLRALAERAQPGLQLAAFLGALGRRTPQQVAVSELQLVREGGGTRFELRGTVDNAQGDASLTLRAFKLALEEEPLVEEAQVQLQAAEGAAIGFRGTIIPRGGRPAPAEGS